MGHPAHHVTGKMLEAGRPLDAIESALRAANVPEVVLRECLNEPARRAAMERRREAKRLRGRGPADPGLRPTKGYPLGRGRPRRRVRTEDQPVNMMADIIRAMKLKGEWGW